MVRGLAHGKVFISVVLVPPLLWLVLLASGIAAPRGETIRAVDVSPFVIAVAAFLRCPADGCVVALLHVLASVPKGILALSGHRRHPIVVWLVYR